MTDPTRTQTPTADPNLTSSAGDPLSTAPGGPTSAAPSAAVAPPGYELLGEVGHGGMGVVHRARDLELDREVAVKLLLPKYAPGSTVARRFVDEARITSQLQHPGVPPVYRVGTLSDGRPFLAMKLVKGQTLDVLLKERGPGSTRWLGVFEGVCQAVGYAHAHGVIHRDLKPANVMVGSFGEVQVMDWGLAKVLPPSPPGGRGVGGEGEQDPDATASIGTEIKSLRDADLLTQYGSILGTPAFMAPEQAIGAVEQIDRRTDVFGLGAILCSLLTGKPPYIGDTAESTRQLAARAKLDDCFTRLDSSAIEPDLVSLCKRCLSAEPGDRPADGREVAKAVAALRAAADDRARRAEIDREKAEVQAAEQRKRRRVWRIAAAVLTLGVIGTTVGLFEAKKQEGIARGEAAAKEKARADEQTAKDDAVESRNELWDGLDAMTTDITGDALASQKDVGPEQKAFLTRMLPLYQKLQAKTGPDRHTRERAARAAERISVIEFRLGNLAAADEACRAAVGGYETLVADFPAETDYRHGLARSRGNLGRVLMFRGQLEESEAETRAALTLQEKLAIELPSDTKVRSNLARGHNSLGELLSRLMRRPEAETEYRAALALFEVLVAERPDEPAYRRDLAGSIFNLGILLADQSDTGKAEEHFVRAVDVQRKLATEPAAPPEHRHDAAIGLTNLGMLHARMGKPSEKEYREALALLEPLTAQFPAQPEYRRSRSETHINLGITLERAGKLPDAEVELRAAVALLTKLAADLPTVPGYRGDLGRAHHHLANLLTTQKKREPAEEQFRAAVTILDKLATDHPSASEHRVQLGKCYSDFAWCVYQVGGDVADALEQSSKAIETLRPIHEKEPRDVRAKQFLRSAYWNRATANDRLQKFDAAVKDWDRAVELSPKGDQQTCRALRVTSKVNAGRVADAIAEVAELRKLSGWKATQLYDFACIYCVASDKIAEEKQNYTDGAVELLQRAVKAGYSDGARLKKDLAIFPIADRADFKQLLAELEAKFPPKREVLPAPRRE